MEANPYAAPKAAVVDVPAAATGEPVFFPVGKVKLAVMSLVTFGLYEIYWFYKNWQCVQRLGENVIAPVRAIFYPLTSYWFFKHVNEELEKAQIGRTLGAGGLAAAVLLLGLLWRLPDPWWAVSFFSFAPLLPVQDAVNELNRKVAPDSDRNARLSGWNIAGIVIGGLFLILTIIGLFLPEA